MTALARALLVPVVLSGAATGVLLLRPGAARLDRVTLGARGGCDVERPESGGGTSLGAAARPVDGPGRGGMGRAGSGSGRSGGAGSGNVPGSKVLRLVPAAAALTCWAAAGPVAAGLAAVLAVVGQRCWLRRRARTARTSERGRALEACAVLRSELRAGRAPAEALAVAATVASDGSALSDALVEATAAGRWGGDVPTALERHAARSAAPDLLRGLAACWRVCTGSGSGLAAAVERLEQGLRSAQTQRDAVEAELAGPRATAGLLALLPLAGTALAAGLGARPVHVLLHTPLGGACLAVGVGLDLVGVWWTGRLVVSAGGEP